MHRLACKRKMLRRLCRKNWLRHWLRGMPVTAGRGIGAKAWPGGQQVHPGGREQK